MKKIFPNASEFSPNVINLKTLLELCKKHENKSDDFIQEVRMTFFSLNAVDSQKQLAANCRAAMVAYGILCNGEIKLTEFGEELYAVCNDDSALYSKFAKHILLNLNGLVLINTIKDMNKANEAITNESVIERLNEQGFELAKSSKKINTMKTWLAKANIFNGSTWRIDNSTLSLIAGISEKDLSCYRDLSREQICFVKALNNTGITAEQKASEIKRLAEATFKISLPSKSFSANIIKPLESTGLIEITKTTTCSGQAKL